MAMWTASRATFNPLAEKDGPLLSSFGALEDDPLRLDRFGFGLTFHSNSPSQWGHANSPEASSSSSISSSQCGQRISTMKSLWHHRRYSFPRRRQKPLTTFAEHVLYQAEEYSTPKIQLQGRAKNQHQQSPSSPQPRCHPDCLLTPRQPHPIVQN